MSKMLFKGQLDTVNTVQKVVSGWAYVAEQDGKEVIDHSGDVWPVAELEKSAHDFVIECRVGKANHQGDKKSELVESIVFTKEKQEALGIDLKKIGWFVSFRIEDEEVLKQVENGELVMFSIGGSGNREEV